MHSLVRCVIIVALTGTTGMAAELPALDSVYGRFVYPGTTQERYLESLHNLFNSQDVNGDGVITSADLGARMQIMAAEQRAQQMSQLLREDLDGDGVITASEIRRYHQSRLFQFGRVADDLGAQAREEMQIQADMAADLNHDGRITLKEAYEFAGARLSPMPAPVDGNITMFNPARKSDGAIAWDSVRAIGQAFFASLDRDHDGVLSAAEVAAVRGTTTSLYNRELRTGLPAMPQPDCAMPKPSAQAQLIFLSAYEAQALSSVTIGSQDVAVGTATIDIAPGASPLYVVISSFRPTIWQFTGATGRVERVVLAATSGQPNLLGPNRPPAPVGETGIPAARTSFATQAGCLRYFSETPSIGAAMASGAVKAQLGREPDVISGKYAVTSFSLPSGTVQAADRNALVVRKTSGTLLLNGGSIVLDTGNALATDMNLYYPGGVIQIDPKSVVANAPAMRYDTLPNQAGLLQLVQQGALSYRNGEFQIRKKIRFPAELYGAHAAKFLLLKGVPKPDGDPGHSCVVSEETGQPLANASLCH